jgi:proteasome component ECM29
LSSALTSIATASLLFGCSSNEEEILRPRATSALDALLRGYTRVIALRADQAKKDKLADELKAQNNNDANPWLVSSSPDLSGNGAGSVETDDTNSAGLARSLTPLIWHAARRSQPKSSRLAAARWSHELMLHIEAPTAYHLLCFLSGDDDATVSMIAKQAMGVDKTLGEDINISSCAKDDSANLPSFGEIMSSVVRSKSRPTYNEFNLRAQTASLRFMVQSLFSEQSFYGDELGGDELNTFVSVIVDTLSMYRNRSLSREETDLVDECSICLSACTSSSLEARLFVRNCNSDTDYGFNDISMQALCSLSAKARRHFSEVVGHLYEDHTLWFDSPDSFSADKWIDVTGLMRIATICRTKLRTMSEPSFLPSEVHGAAFLGSQCVRAYRLAEVLSEQDTDDDISNCWTVCARIVELLGKGLIHSDTAIGNACSRAIVIAFSYDGQDAPILHKKLFDSVAVALDEMSASLRKFSSVDYADANRTASLIEASGLLLSASTSGAGSVNLGAARLLCVDTLFGVLGSAVYKQDDELSLAVGGALVKYADALGQGKWSCSNSAVKWPEGYDEKFAFSLPPHVHILYTLFERELKSSNPMKKNSCAPVMLAIAGHASRLCNIDPSCSQRAMIQEVTKPSLMIRFQTNFIQLLSHPKATQLSRESCCRGIAALRGLSTAISIPAIETESLNERLLKAFGGTSNYGGSAMMETDVQARERRNNGDTIGNLDVTSADVGGASGLSEAALGAYREMARAAISVDRPDILYILMILSTSHQIWSAHEVRDRYGAKSILGSNSSNDTEVIRIALRPHLGKLIPRLLRACNDPSKQTREQMNNLWIGLTGGGAESRALITQHFLATFDVLIEEAGSKFWRARVGACGALADIIVGRSWGDLGGGGVETDDEGAGMAGVTASVRLLRLWRITMRALDDVRTAVRERGDTLGRGVRALTIRLCDPNGGGSTKEENDVYLSNAERKRREEENDVNSGYAATVSLGWLVKYGLNQPCAEATGICISCLLGIVDVSKPTTLQPVLTELIGSLLMAMSGLEPSALNYLQVRAAGYENSQGANAENGYDRLERLRIQLASSGPIAEVSHTVKSLCILL